GKPPFLTDLAATAGCAFRPATIGARPIQAGRTGDYTELEPPIPVGATSVAMPLSWSLQSKSIAAEAAPTGRADKTRRPRRAGLFLLGPDHHDHLAAFQARIGLHLAVVADVFLDLAGQVLAQ